MADITIMGAGAFGLSLALVCAERGARVHVIEKRHIGAGSSGGLVGALAPHVPENWNAKKAFQFEALRMAEGFWARAATLSGTDPGYARLGRVQPVTEDSFSLARTRAGNAAELWQGFATWQVIRAQDAPGLPIISPSGWVIHDTLSARLHPRRAGQALAGAVQALGGKISFGDTQDGDGLTVWATGYEGLHDLSAALGRPIGSGVKGQSILLRHASPDAPQIFADGLHIVPHSDGTVAIGSTSEREFTDASSVDGQCDVLLARARSVCPALQDAPVIDAWAGVRPRATSRAPLLGPWPGRDKHFVFNGGFKIGFAMAPVLAGCMADLVLEGRDTIPEGFGFSAV